MQSVIDVIDGKTAVLKDERVTRGEAVVLMVKPGVELNTAMKAVISDLMRFMSKSTGKMYTQHIEAYSNSYRVQEPGHPSYGLRVLTDTGRILIQPIAVLEDVTILRRYVQKIKRAYNETQSAG